MLIACVGNIFFGDDGFGVEVARRLATRDYPVGVEVIDFGIAGVDLAYTLLDGCETLVLVDAVARGGPPGTLYVIEPDAPPSTDATPEARTRGAGLDAHSMDPLKTLAFAYRLGAQPGRTLLVGCEPGWIPGEDELAMGLSAPAQAALTQAVDIIDALVAQYHPAASATQGNATQPKGDTSWAHASAHPSP